MDADTTQLLRSDEAALGRLAVAGMLVPSPYWFPVLLHGTACARLGVMQDWERIVWRLREAWPDVHIRWRGDCGFAAPAVYQGSESLDIEYTLGLAMNPTLKKLSEETLQMAVQQ